LGNQERNTITLSARFAGTPKNAARLKNARFAASPAAVSSASTECFQEIPAEQGFFFVVAQAN
jgi:hypothetical protein